MKAHQPGSMPIDIPETVPNPAHTRVAPRPHLSGHQPKCRTRCRKGNPPASSMLQARDIAHASSAVVCGIGQKF